MKQATEDHQASGCQTALALSCPGSCHKHGSSRDEVARRVKASTQGLLPTCTAVCEQQEGCVVSFRKGEEMLGGRLLGEGFGSRDSF